MLFNSVQGSFLQPHTLSLFSTIRLSFLGTDPVSQNQRYLWNPEDLRVPICAVLHMSQHFHCSMPVSCSPLLGKTQVSPCSQSFDYNLFSYPIAMCKSNRENTDPIPSGKLLLYLHTANPDCSPILLGRTMVNWSLTKDKPTSKDLDGQL